MKKTNYFGVVFAAIVAFFAFLGGIYNLLHYGLRDVYSFFVELCVLVAALAVIFYDLFGYKIKGNLLKCTIFFFAAVLILKLVGSEIDYHALFLIGAASVILGFIAGRLDRNKEAIVLGIVIFVLLVCFSIYVTIFNYVTNSIELLDEIEVISYNPDLENGAICPLNKVFEAINFFDLALIWISLCLAYFVRYREHKALKASE